MDSLQEMRDFLDYNNMKYSSGYARVDDLDIEYNVGKHCLEKCSTHVIFNVQYDFEDRIVMNELDSNRLHRGFTATYQDFKFDNNSNTLTIDSINKNNKHNEKYQIIISG